MLRWGMLGTSAHAGDAVAPALRALGHDLAVVGSRSRSRARQFAATQGVRRARGSYDEVLAADDVDCVFIGLPNAAHEDWAVAALQAGKHVLCAKPLATSAPGVRRMAAAAAAAGRELMEAVWSRAHPRTEALLGLIRDGELGAVRGITAALGARPVAARDIRFDPLLGGGALLDGGADQVAMVRLLLGEHPDGVAGVARQAPTGVDTAAAVALRFPSGATAALHAALDLNGVDELTVAGTHVAVRLPRAFRPPPGTAAVLERNDGTTQSFQADPVAATIQRFAETLVEGRPPLLPLDDAIAAAEILDGIRANLS